MQTVTNRTGLRNIAEMRRPSPPSEGDHVEFPVAVALAQLVPRLPTGPGWWYEIKLDGHRTVLWRTTEGVRLQARSGRDVTASWEDIARAGMDSLGVDRAWCDVG